MTEAALDGYVVDILRSGLIVEVQTANFSCIARKIRDLVSRHRVRLVYPVARDLWIVKLAQTAGDAPTRRKSPKHRQAIDVFSELVSFPELIAHPNFELDVVATGEETVWRLEGGRLRWRRKGWVTVERRLLSVHGTTEFRRTADYAAMLPAGLPAEFLTSDLALALGRPRHFAQQMAFCLRKAGVIEQVGSRGNAIVYTKVRARSATGRRPRMRAARGAVAV